MQCPIVGNTVKDNDAKSWLACFIYHNGTQPLECGKAAAVRMRLGDVVNTKEPAFLLIHNSYIYTCKMTDRSSALHDEKRTNTASLMFNNSK